MWILIKVENIQCYLGKYRYNSAVNMIQRKGS